MPTPKHSTAMSVWAALLSVYVVWGSTYLAIRFAVGTIPPFFMGGTRFLVSGLILYFLVIIFSPVRPRPIHWRSSAIVGFLLITVGNGGVSWAEQKVPSGIACLLVATVPLWMVLLDWLWKKHARPNAKIVMGLSLGFCGTALLAFSSGDMGTGADSGRVLGLLCFPLAWALGSLYARSAPLPSSALLSTAMEMICGGLFQLVLSAFCGEWGQVDFQRFTALSEWSWVYLTLVGSLVGFTSYIWVLQKSNPALASTYAFVNPVIAVFLGWLFAGEAVTLPVFAAAGLIVAAVILITLYAPIAKNKT